MKTAEPNLTLNILINISAILCSLAALFLASHSNTAVGLILAVVVFSYTNNTLFALLHEAVHRVYSTQAWPNEIAGVINGAMFPTGLTFQRICHLGHHLRNRTDHEMFDMYYPDDNLFLKRAQFYSILTGIYWITVPLGWLMYLIFPWSYKLLKTENKTIKHTGAIMLHPFIDHPKKWRIRFELVFVIVFQWSVFVFLDLKFWPTFLCYWVFGLVWGSLQYADHAWSPRDVLKGAWNLKTNPITRAFFLNYHFHQVHHMNPKLPWNHLPRHVEAGSAQPSFWEVYLEMWKGPRAASAPSPKPIREVVERLSDDEDLNLSINLTCELNCLKQFWFFTLRHPRYGFIALLLYLVSFRSWSMARRLRHGFAALQLIDDILDGDRPSTREPLEISTELQAALRSQNYDESDLHRLFMCYRSQFETSDLPELDRLLFQVIEAMSFDRVRVKDKLILSAQDLKTQHQKTFTASMDLLLLSCGSRQRSQDVSEVIDLFMWSSIVRDLKVDTSKGLINIPSEFWQGSLSAPLTQKWLAQELDRQQSSFQGALVKWEKMQEPVGKRVFGIFIRSMRKYLKPELIHALR